MSTIKVNRRELLRFMNSGDAEANGHHTGMTSLMGEPLAVGLLLHYLRQQSPKAQCVSTKVTPGTRKGSRLDAWVYDGEKTLYQTEIKMWAGNAIGGVHIKDDADAAWLASTGESQWHRWIWNKELATFQDDNVRKVLMPMQRPSSSDVGVQSADVEPLLCIWWLVASEENAKENCPAWFTLPVSKESGGVFDHVHVFSLSRYLMGLSEEVVDLEMPLLTQRLNWLRRIFPA